MLLVVLEVQQVVWLQQVEQVLFLTHFLEVYQLLVYMVLVQEYKHL